MSTEGSTKAVLAALAANLGIAVVKFAAFVLAKNSSMLAEAIHSVADSGNQLLLLVGARTSRKAPTEEHPFGYGRERYLYGFIVSVVLFSVGGLFALYEAYHKFHEVAGGHIEHVHGWKQYVPLVILVISAALEGMSFRTALREANHARGDASVVEYIRRAKSPELPVVLLEDFAALCGLIFALLGVALSLITGNQYFDAAGTTLIGLLLVCVAVVLALETKSLLIGESASLEAQEAIAAAITATPGVDRIIHMRTLHLGPEELLVGVKTGVAPPAPAAEIAATIDAAEVRLRAAEPAARVVYIEPDIFRG